jgi:hypothetical protein
MQMSNLGVSFFGLYPQLCRPYTTTSLVLYYFYRQIFKRYRPCRTEGTDVASTPHEHEFKRRFVWLKFNLPTALSEKCQLIRLIFWSA